MKDGGVVGTLSALKANDSKEDCMVRSSELGEVFRAEGLRHTPAQQGPNHLGLQHANFRAGRGGRHIVHFRAEPFEACLQKTDRSVDFKQNVSVFVDRAA